MPATLSGNDLQRIIDDNPGATQGAIARIACEQAGLSDVRNMQRRVARHRGLVALDEGDHIHASTTLVDAEGNIRLQWQRALHTQFAEIAKAIVEGLTKDVSAVKRTPAPRRRKGALMTCYMIGDAHVGMYSWGAETGENFDLKIAEADLLGAMDRLIESSPESETCLIVNLGDYFHIDSTSNMTPGSGNALDADGRFFKVLQVGCAAMRALIDKALKEHRWVIVRNVAGNHDPHSSMTLTLTMQALYEKEPRVIIEDSPAAFWTHRFGTVLLGITHGHMLKKPELMASHLAVVAPEDWGKSKHRFVWHGHIHHRRVLEHAGVEVESFRTLAGKDAWHAAMGYNAAREMQCIVLHKEDGAVERHFASINRARRG